MSTYTLTRTESAFDLNITNADANKQVTLTITPGKTTVLKNLPSVKEIDARISQFLFWCVTENLPIEQPVIVQKREGDVHTIRYGNKGVYVTEESKIDFIKSKFQEKMQVTKNGDPSNPFSMVELAKKIESNAPTPKPVQESVTPPKPVQESVIPAPPATGSLVAELTIADQRLGKDTLPASVILQRGNIFGTTIAWDDPREEVLVWNDAAAAVQIHNTDELFAGYEDGQHIYLENDGLLLGQKKCIRVINVDAKKPVIPKTDSILFLMNKDNIEEWFARQHKSDPSAVESFLQSLVAKYSVDTTTPTPTTTTDDIDDLLQETTDDIDDLLEEADTATPTRELFEEWCKPYKKDGSGGLPIKELREKAIELGVDAPKGTKRKDILEMLCDTLLTEVEKWCKPYKKDGSGGLSIKELRKVAGKRGVKGADDKSRKEISAALKALDTDTDETTELTAELIEEWCKPYKKNGSGGLPLKELREKAEDYIIDDLSDTKRSAIKKMLLEQLDDEPEATEEEVTEEMVEQWCKPYKKNGSGGLPLKELRQKAVSFGIDGADKLSRKDIKEVMVLFI